MRLSVPDEGRCQATSQDNWINKPHCWRQCRALAKAMRDGLEVCKAHEKAETVWSFNTSEEKRPAWGKWKREGP